MRLRIAAVALLAGLALAACGSSSKSSSGSFCSKAKADQEKYKNTTATDKATLQSEEKDFQSLVDDAPAAIKSEMQSVLDGLKQSLTDTTVSQADQSKFDAASEKVTNFFKDTCGITNDTTATT